MERRIAKADETEYISLASYVRRLILNEAQRINDTTTQT